MLILSWIIVLTSRAYKVSPQDVMPRKCSLLISYGMAFDLAHEQSPEPFISYMWQLGIFRIASMNVRSSKFKILSHRKVK
jgi:hypothetical protein